MKALATSLCRTAMSRLPLLPPLFLFAALALWSGCDAVSEPEPGDDLIEWPIVSTTLIDSYPAWSPDGRTIAYTHQPQTEEEAQNGAEMQLWLLDVETGEKRFLTLGWLPAWSPDGARIAYVRGGYDAADIYVVEVATGAVERLTEWGWCFYPSWSPDGTRIAFDTNHGDEKGANVIWIMSADGSGKRDISQHGVGEWRMPSWSPDGSKILHIRYVSDKSAAGVLSSELFTMDTTGGSPIRLTQNAGDDGHPAWSPDGSQIAWNSSGGDSDSGVWVMNADGTGQRLYVPRSAHPSWSPDGRRVVFLRWHNEVGTLWIADGDGSDARALTTPEDYLPPNKNGGEPMP